MGKSQAWSRLLLWVGFTFFLLSLLVGCNTSDDPVLVDTDRQDSLSTGEISVNADYPLTSGTETHEITTPEDRPKYLPDEVLVVFHDPEIVPSVISLDTHGLEIKKEIPLSWCTLFEMTITDGTPVEEMVESLRSIPEIRFVEPNHIYYLAETPYFPNDPKWESGDAGEDPRDNIYDQWGPAKIGADIVWNDGFGSEDVVIAVLDTGIRLDHEDLADNLWINEDEIPDNGIDDDANSYIDDVWGWDMADGDNNPWDEGYSGTYHGTACAGVAAAICDNGVGLSGVAPGVRIMALRIAFDTTWESKAVEAVDYAASNRADILSMSFGGTEDSEIFHTALDHAWDNGHGANLLACAQNYDSTVPHYPAAYDSVMSIGATIPFSDSGVPIDEKKITSYEDGYYWGSNYGDWLTVMGFGDKYITTSGSSSYGYYDGISEGFFGGTSCATPMSAGVMALIRSFHPNKGASWYWDRLQDSADDLGAVGFDIYTGYGRCNAVRAVYGSDRYAEYEDPLGFVTLTDPDQVFDTIHDLPGNQFYDVQDLYRFTVYSQRYAAIDLDIYTWGEDLDMGLYTNEEMSDQIGDATGPNHHDSSIESIGMSLGPGEYFLKVYSPAVGSSTTYGLSLETFLDGLFITGESIAPEIGCMGEHTTPFLKLELEVGHAATLDEVIISKSGTAPSGAVIQTRLFIDSNGNGEYDNDDEILSVGYSDGTNRFKFQDIDTYWTYEENLVLFIGAVINGAPVGSNIRFSLESYKDVITLDGLEAHYTDFPIISDLVELDDDNEAPYWPVSVGIQYATPGYEIVVLGFNEAVDDCTPPVKYNVYYTDTIPFNIETAEKIPDIAVETGPSTDFRAVVTDLPLMVDLFFVVRAEDQVGNEDENLEVFSCMPQIISNPEHPLLIGEYDINGAHDITIDEGLIVVPSGTPEGYQIFDCSDPFSLELIYTTPWSTGPFSQAKLDYPYLYLGGHGFKIWDITIPTEINQLYTYPMSGVSQMILYDNWIYVEGYYDGTTFFSFDVTDPSDPVPYDPGPVGGDPFYDFECTPDYMYITGQFVFGIVLDRSDPSMPFVLGNFSSEDLLDLEIVGDYMFSTNHYTDEFNCYNIGIDPVNPPLIDSISVGEAPSGCDDVLMMGNTAYVAVGLYGFVTFDVSDPYNMELLTSFELSHIVQFATDGTFIYAVGALGGGPDYKLWVLL